jgi:hypothetical protein
VSAPARFLRTLAAVGVVAAVTLPAAPAAAQGTGYVRLAHLSPDTPAVDVYLRSTTGAIAQKVFPGVGYGALSDYLPLPAGTYVVAMRKANAQPSTKALLTTEVTVVPGRAYTVAGVGRFADLGLRVLRDDLTLPRAGDAKVRIIQASVRAPVLTVAVENGTAIGRNVAFATTTGYRQVPPGTWTLRVQPATGAAASTLPATLSADTVYSLLIVDGKSGSLQAQLHKDAARSGPVPAGGVATGAGGTAGSTPWLGAGTAAAAAALVVGAGLLLAGRRRALAR